MARTQSITTSATRATTNRAEIRRWVESKGGFPARVKGSERGTDPGLLRINFPGYSGVESLTKMSWNDWFKWFDKKRLAFVHQPTTRFTKLIPRDTLSLSNGAGTRTTSTRATPRRASGAKRATTAKRTTAKRTTKKPTTRATTTRRVATTSRGAVKRTTSAKRGAVKRTTKRPTTKRTTKRSSAKRTSR